MGNHDAERRHDGPARSKPGVTTRILIALSATYFRRGIEDRLGAEPGLEVVATADDGPSALGALVEARGGRGKGRSAKPRQGGGYGGRGP